MRTRYKGFTLIELLVVIAIIAILAAILFPLMTKAKEKGKQTKCCNNLVQIARGMTMYGDDWSGKFPWAYEWATKPNLPSVLGRKYVTGRAVFACPSDVGEVGSPPFGTPGTPWWKTFESSYNWPGVNYIGQYPHLAGLSMSNPTIPNPGGADKWIWQKPLSQRIMIFDGRPWHNLKNKGASWWLLEGLTVVVYCDGHAKPLDNKHVLVHLGITD